MAPIQSYLIHGIVFSSFLALAVGAAKDNRPIGVNQICEFPQLNVCRPARAKGLIEDKIRVWFKDMGPHDPRREFLEAKWMIKQPEYRDPNYDEYQDTLSKVWGPISEAQRRLFEEEEKERAGKPQKSLEELLEEEKAWKDNDDPYPGKEQIERDEIDTLNEICCRDDWECLTSENAPEDIMCYSDKLTSIMITELVDFYEDAGLLNVMDLTYTRRDGVVFPLTGPDVISLPVYSDIEIITLSDARPPDASTISVERSQSLSVPTTTMAIETGDATPSVINSTSTGTNTSAISESAGDKITPSLECPIPVFVFIGNIILWFPALFHL